MSEQNNHILKWEAPEFKHYHKNFGWYFTFWSVITLIVIYQIINKDVFGAFSVGFIAILGAILLKQKPENVEIRLTNTGLHIDDIHIAYKNMRHFWVVNTEDHRTLNIETTAYLNNFLIIELEEQDPETIRNILLPVVPEHEMTTPTTTQRIMHLLKM